MRKKLAIITVWFVAALAAEAAKAAAPAAPPVARPMWMDDEGIVMAASWRSPASRARALGRMDFTLPILQYEGLRREHSQAVLDALKRLGVNVVLTHFYEGFGRMREQAGMIEAQQFAERARQNRMRVGAYIGGSLGWETLFRETPAAAKWQAIGPDGEPVLVNPNEPFRRAVVHHHPGYIEHLEPIVRSAIQEMRADMVYFDGLDVGGAGWDPLSTREFQDSLADRKVPNYYRVKPPVMVNLTNEVDRAWIDYRCEALTRYYRAMSRCVTSTSSQCVMAGNTGGLGADNPMLRGVDHAKLLPLGSAFWGERHSAGWKDGRPVTRIRSLKAGQAFGNSTLLFSETPLDVAENMAFNKRCLGCIAWFENGEIISCVGRAGPPSPFLKPYVDFYRAHPQFYIGTTLATDVAVVRTYKAFAHGTEQERRAIYDAEQALIESQTPFALLFDGLWDDLDAFRAIVTPGAAALDDKQRKALEGYRLRGGELVDAATLRGDPQRARERLQRRRRLTITAPPAVAVEAAERRMVPEVLVHLVNYNVEQPVKDIA
ncbi:MAG: hypothetical protein N2689_12640, partial [Verrucomicrobiae bacterium]|nr:hypothetical protein [Verrucomicrobiae bacterium]